MKAVAQAFLLSLAAVLLPALAAARPTLAVVVNRRNPVREISLRELKSVYGARSHFWRDGQPVIAVNREAGSTTREEFSMLVFGRSSREMSGYWNERYFQGVLPPLVLTSDEAVIRYVERTLGAVGYVPARKADDRVKVILILERR